MSSASALVKMIVGVIIILAGLWLILPASWLGFLPGPKFALWRDLWTIIKGTVPLGLVLLGLLLIWIESEELKGGKK